MSMTTVQVDQERLGALARKHGLDLVVLFGSQAKGRTHSGSDVDVAVRFRPGQRVAWHRKLDVASQLDSAFPDSGGVDVAFLNDASSLLLFEVAATGQALYERQPLLFWQFQSYAARRYDDEHKFRLRRAAYLADWVKPWGPSKRRSSGRS